MDTSEFDLGLRIRFALFTALAVIAGPWSSYVFCGWCDCCMIQSTVIMFQLGLSMVSSAIILLLSGTYRHKTGVAFTRLIRVINVLNLLIYPAFLLYVYAMIYHMF